MDNLSTSNTEDQKRNQTSINRYVENTYRFYSQQQHANVDVVSNNNYISSTSSIIDEDGCILAQSTLVRVSDGITKKNFVHLPNKFKGGDFFDFTIKGDLADVNKVFNTPNTQEGLESIQGLMKTMKNIEFIYGNFDNKSHIIAKDNFLDEINSNASSTQDESKNSFVIDASSQSNIEENTLKFASSLLLDSVNKFNIMQSFFNKNLNGSELFSIKNQNEEPNFQE